MKLVTFQIGTPLGPFCRVGALHGQNVVDLNMAYVRWLSDQEEPQPQRLADAAGAIDHVGIPGRRPIDNGSGATRVGLCRRHRSFSPRPRCGNAFLSAEHGEARRTTSQSFFPP